MTTPHHSELLRVEEHYFLKFQRRRFGFSGTPPTATGNAYLQVSTTQWLSQPLYRPPAASPALIEIDRALNACDCECKTPCSHSSDASRLGLIDGGGEQERERGAEQKACAVLAAQVLARAMEESADLTGVRDTLHGLLSAMGPTHAASPTSSHQPHEREWDLVPIANRKDNHPRKRHKRQLVPTRAEIRHTLGHLTKQARD
jgi:hypothetical protein